MFYNKSLRFKHSIQPKSGDLWDENIHKFDKKGKFFKKNTNFEIFYMKLNRNECKDFEFYPFDL